MNRLIDRAILLADASRWNNMSQRFQGRNTRLDLNDVLTGLLILGGAISVFWLISLVVRLRDQHRTFSSPAALFFTLCKAHRLRWSEMSLLWRVARAHRLSDPAQLFLRPELLNPAKLEPSLRMRSTELLRLGKMLFAEPPEEEKKPTREDPSPQGASTKVETKDAGDTAATTKKPASPLPPALDVAPWPPLSGFEQDASKQ